jgi:hypothetical protein
MHPVLPPSGLAASLTPRGLRLTWTPSPDGDLLGYHVYRASSDAGPFTRVTGSSPISGTSFDDTPPAGTYTYMVRAIKLEQSSSGTYLNPSQGVFTSATMGVATQSPTLQIKQLGNTVSITALQPATSPFIIEISPDLSNWSPLLTNSPASGTFDFSEPIPPDIPARFYRSRSP